MPVATLLAVIVGLATLVLGFLAYSMLGFEVRHLTREFRRVLGRTSALGATLGAFWGLQIVSPLGQAAFGGAAPVGITEWISAIGNTTTLGTITGIAACTPKAVTTVWCDWNGPIRFRVWLAGVFTFATIAGVNAGFGIINMPWVRSGQ